MILLLFSCRVLPAHIGLFVLSVISGSGFIIAVIVAVLEQFVPVLVTVTI